MADVRVLGRSAVLARGGILSGKVRAAARGCRRRAGGTKMWSFRHILLVASCNHED